MSARPAASLGQTGQGHINNHRLEYIEAQMAAMGYALSANRTARLRHGEAAAGLPLHAYLTGRAGGRGGGGMAVFERYQRISPCTPRPSGCPAAARAAD